MKSCCSANRRFTTKHQVTKKLNREAGRRGERLALPLTLLQPHHLQARLAVASFLLPASPPRCKSFFLVSLCLGGEPSWHRHSPRTEIGALDQLVFGELA